MNRAIWLRTVIAIVTYRICVISRYVYQQLTLPGLPQQINTSIWPRRNDGCLDSYTITMPRFNHHATQELIGSRKRCFRDWLTFVLIIRDVKNPLGLANCCFNVVKHRWNT